MNRRSFLRVVGAAGVAWNAAPRGWAAEASDKLIFSAPLTHSDWMLRDSVPGVVWGTRGVEHMLDACKATGWSRVYWRVLDGGKSLYKSKLVTPGEHLEYDTFYNPVTPEEKQLLERYSPKKIAGQYFRSSTPDPAQVYLEKAATVMDYSTFDSLAAAVSYGHKIGLQIHAWVSINEDDHGWGLRSDFSLKYPEYRWRKRNGDYYHSQISFAFPEATEYKLGIIKELLQNYEIDGLFLDWLRTGDVRDNPQTDADGVADHGYEQPLVEGFKQKYGSDPRDLPNGDERWVRYRAQPHTDFMRGVRQLTHSQKPHMPISVMGANPWCYRGLKNPINGNLRGLLLDVNAWAREGLIDDAVAGGYYLTGGTPEKAFQALQEETEGKVNVWLYAWVPSQVSDFERDFALARKVGAKQILFWEADYIDGRPNKDELQRTMSAHAVKRSFQ